MAKEFTYRMNIDADINALSGKLKTLKSELASITDEGKEPKLSKLLDQLGTKLDALKSKASTPIKSEAAFGAMEKDLQGVYRLLEALGVEISNVSKLSAEKKIEFLPKEQQQRLARAVNAMAQYAKSIENAAKKSDALNKAEEAQLKAQRVLEQRREKEKVQQQAAIKATKDREEAENKLNAAYDRQREALKKQQDVERGLKEIQGDKRSGKFIVEDPDGTQREITLAKARAEAKAAAAAAEADNIRDLEVAVSSLKRAESEAATAKERATVSLHKANIEYENATAKVKDLIAVFDANKLKAESDAFIALRREAQDLGINLDGIGADNTAANIDLLQQRMQEFLVNGVEPTNEQCAQAAASLHAMGVAADDTANSIQKDTLAFREQNEAAGQVSGIISRIKQFTGLTGVALVMRRALQSAINTTKELDKQMTEMAVVTDLKVGDYWKQLPEHTARANALGVAIKDVYEAETLYYQQGLKTAEVTALSTSTLKMARIASLSAEDATNKMTAALRGFNMEINETNAERIADVYSKLAAITASDVEEISTAMTKTASLASNAGMQFETTAALLAQVIETTRESAETAGTALKTVIARFQELKKAPEEIGEVDGEIVDANKIETALRTVGVALRDTQGQFRDLDEVFLELSSKWQSLDTNTQRYIATIAAGSRQQSRFIAMMSNYQRTQELVNAANTAAGASNEQFAKTLESLQSKLAQLKNAWDTFTQGLANNEFIKVGVDILTKFMTIINKITEGWGAWSSSALKIGLVTIALTLGGKALKIFTNELTKATTDMGIFDKASLGVKAVFDSMKASLANAANNTKKFGARLTALGSRLSILTKEQAIANAALFKYNQLIQQGAVKDAVYDQTIDELRRSFLSYGKSIGLTATQSYHMLTLTRAGVPIEQAALLAKQNLTKATIEQELAIKNLNGALSKEQMQTLKVAEVEGASGLSGTLSGLGKTLGKSKGEWGAWFKNLGSGFKDLGKGILNFVKNFWQFIAAAAVLAATIVAIVAIVKAFKRNSPAGQLELAAQRAQELSNAAASASEKFSTLTDKFKAFSEAQTSIENLTRGTQEWKDAVLEVNKQYLELLELYPELAKLETTIKNGYIEFVDEDAVNKVINQASVNNIKAQAAATNAQLEVLRRQQDVDFSDLSRKAKVGKTTGAGWGAWGSITGTAVGGGAGAGALAGAGIGGGIGSLPASAVGAIAGAAIGLVGGTITAFSTGAIEDARDAAELRQKELTDKFARSLVGATDKTQKEIEEWLYEQGADIDLASDLVDVQTELRAYGERLIEAEQTTRAYITALRQNILNTIDATNFSVNQITQMGTLLTDDYIQKIQNQISAEVTAAGDKKNPLRDENNKMAQAYRKYFESQYGSSVVIGKHGEVTYTDEAGEQQTIDAKTAQAAFATSEAMDEFKKRAELLTKALSKAGDKTEGLNDAINKAYMNDEGLGLTREALNQLATAGATQELWSSSPELQKLYSSFDEFNSEMMKRVATAQEAFNANRAELDRFGLRNVNLNNDLTAEAEKGLINGLRQVTAMSMDGGGERVAASLNNLLNTISPDEVNDIAAILYSIDWHDADALEALPETLKEMGKTVPEEELDAFIDDTKVLANALHKVDLAKLNEDLIAINKGLQDIRTNDQQRVFDKDLYETFTNANNDLKQYFRQNLEGKFIFLGSNISLLTDAVLDNTDALVEERTRVLSNSQGTRAILDNMAAQGGDIRNWNSWSFDKRLDFLTQLQTNAKREGIELGDTNKYLSNDTAISQLTPTMVKEIFSTLVGLGTVQSIQKEIDNEVVTARVTALLRNNASLNAYEDYSAQIRKGQTFNSDDQASFRAAREALLVQAQDNGVSEQDYKQLAQYNEILIKLEEKRLTNTKEYKKAVEDASKAVHELQTKSSFQTMYEGMRQNVSEAHELMETYHKTTSAMEQQHLVAQMVSEFQLKVTEDNMDAYATYVDAMTHGSEQALENLVNLSGHALTGETEAYTRMSEKTTDQIKEDLGEAGLEFMRIMENAKYGWLETIEDGVQIWHWGVAELEDAAKDLVGKIEGWLNPYDWLYNTNQDINAQLRERERLERKWSLALEDNSLTVNEMANTLAGEVAITQDIANKYSHIYTEAEKELTDYITYLNSQGGAMPVLSNAFAVGADGRIAANKDLLFSLDLTSDAGGLLEEEVNRIQSLIDTMRDAEDQINDANDYLREIRKTGRDEYVDLVDRVADALKQQYQREIDTLSAINDSITDAASQLTDKLQEKIDDDRQARDNAKTEQALTDKAAQIAYLQASGANQLEILKLQQELSDEQQNYTDSLVDQSIDSLTRANEAAANQRQEQIDIAQSQYDWWEKHDAIHDAEQVVNQSVLKVAEGVSATDTKMGELLSKEENMPANMKTKIDEWTKGLELDTKLATIYSGLNGADGSVQNKVNTVNDSVGTLNTKLTGAINDTTNKAAEISRKFKNYNEGNTTLLTSDDIENLTTDSAAQKQWWSQKLAAMEYTIVPNSSGGYDIKHSNGSSGKTGENVDSTKYTTSTPPTTKDTNKSQYNAFNDTATTSTGKQGILMDTTTYSIQGYGNGFLGMVDANRKTNDIDLVIDGVKYDFLLGSRITTSNSEFEGIRNALGGRSPVEACIPGESIVAVGDQLYLYGKDQNWHKLELDHAYGGRTMAMAAEALRMRQFASGGLANFTGPAWLDGTSSSPELILNATDTANFIELRNILADFLKDSPNSSGGMGNNYYNIDVHVDNIDSDYDIDSAANHMKELIEADAMYRNVNAIQQIR